MNHTFKKFILIVLVILLNSCEKKIIEPEKEPEPGTGTISISSTTLRGWEFATITVSDYDLTKDFYELEVGSVKVAVNKSSDNQLSILIPGELSSGKHLLKAGFAKNTIELNISAPVVVTDPIKYLSDFNQKLEEELQILLDQYDERVSTGELSGSEAEALKEALKASYNEIPSFYEGLNSEEKIMYIQIMESNIHLLNEFKSFYSNSKTDRMNDSHCHDLYQYYYSLPDNHRKKNDAWLAWTQCNSSSTSSVFDKNDSFLSKLGIAYSNAKEVSTSQPSKRKAIVAFVKTFLSQTKTIIIEEKEKVKEALNDPFGLKSLDEAFSNRMSEIEYINQKEVNVKAVVTLINFSLDPSKQIPSFNHLNQKVKSYNNKLSSVSELAPGLTPLSFDNYKEKSLYLTSFTIEEISDPRVKVELIETDTEKKVKFYTDCGATENISFTYKMKVASDFGNVAKVVPAKLVVSSPAKVVLADGNKQTGEFGKQLPKPLKVKVLDSHNEGLECIEVEWKVKTGGGTLSHSKSTTNAEGIAEVYWTLGATGDQEVEALVKKPDNTLVEGTPLIFQTLKDPLLGKWVFHKIMYSDGYVHHFQGDQVTFDFLSSGKCIYFDKEEDIYAEFGFTKSAESLILSHDEGITTYKIVKLDQDELILKIEEEDYTIYLKKIN